MFENISSIFKIRKVWSSMKGASASGEAPAMNEIFTGAMMIIMGVFAIAKTFMFSDKVETGKHKSKKEDVKPDENVNQGGGTTAENTPKNEESAKAEINSEDQPSKGVSFDDVLQSTANLLEVFQYANQAMNANVKTALDDAKEVVERAKETADMVDKQTANTIESVHNAGMFAKSKFSRLFANAKAAMKKVADDVRVAISPLKNE